MTDQSPEVRLLSACVSMSANSWQELAGALSAYVAQYQNEMLGATGEDVLRCQGKAQAAKKLFDVVIEARQRYEKMQQLKQRNQVHHGGA